MTQSSPRVTIGLSTYKGILYIEKAIKSLLSQSFTDFELVISDNGSTDGSAEVCTRFAKQDPRIRYSRNEINIGTAGNFNFLLSQAKGKYFMWAADDDLWHVDFIKTLVDALDKNENAVSAMTAVMFIDENDKKISGLEHYECTDYSAESAYTRVSRLITKHDDSMTYGLFRTDKIRGMYIAEWKGVNKPDPINCAFPALCFLLTKGDFVLAGDQPMWFNRLKTNANLAHGRPFPNSFVKAQYATILRKLNLVYEACRSVRIAGGSILLVVRLLPKFLYFWVLKDVAGNFLGDLKRLKNKEVDFF